MMTVPTWCRAFNAVGNDTKSNTSAGTVTARAVYLGLFLFGLWLLLSGHYVPLLLTLGIACSVFVVAIGLRMDIVDRENHPIHLHPTIVFFWLWLAWEIIKANVDVARRILDPKLPISPNLISVKATQKSDLGRVSYANSITLTPGTVCVGVEGDTIQVHALTREAAQALAAGEMDRRVTRIEKVL